MKLNPMSPKIAAVILLATTGATLSVTPAQAAEEIPIPVTQTIDKYDLASFSTSAFESPQVVSWAVAYSPNLTGEAGLDPAEKALLTDGANLAQKQKTIIEKNAAVVRAELQRIAEEKAAVEKAAAEKAAAAKAAAEKLAAEKAEAERKEAESVAQQAAVAQAQEVARVTAQRAAAYQVAAPTTQWNSTAVTAQSATPTVAGNSVPVANAPASSGIGAGLVAAAYNQIGIDQDCTAMVEKALRSVGKNVGDLAPLDFYRYGTVVTNPQPGDLMIRPGHVAIYVGNGMAISGGFNGGHTELHPASYLAGSVFVRVS